MNAKPTARPTCDQLCMLKDIQLMNSGIIASNQDLFVPWPGFFFYLDQYELYFTTSFFKVISLRGMCSSRQLPTRSSATNPPLPDVYDKMVCYACDPSWMWLMAGWQCSQKFIAGYNFVWDGCDDERLLNAWHEFKQWARQNKWQPLGFTDLAVITTGCLF